MSITFVASADATSSAATFTVNKPTGTVDNDVMFMAGGNQNSVGDYFVPPAGWDVIDLGDTGKPWPTLYYRIASGEGGSYTVSQGAGGGTNHVVIATYRSSIGVLSINTAGTWATSSTTLTPSAASISPSAAGRLVFIAIDDQNSVTSSPPSGLTENVDLAGVNKPCVTFASVDQASGATGAKSNTFTGTAALSSAILLQLVETSSGGGGGPSYGPIPSYVSASALVTANNAATDVVYPATVNTNDIAIIGVRWYDGSTPSPSGFTQMGSTVTLSTSAKFALFWKRCLGTEAGTTVSIASTGTTIQAAQLFLFSDVVTSGVPYESLSNNTWSGTTFSPASFTTSGPNELGVVISEYTKTTTGGSVTTSVGGTWIEKVDNYGSNGARPVALVVATKDFSSASSVSPSFHSLSTSCDDIGFSFALIPRPPFSANGFFFGSNF